MYYHRCIGYGKLIERQNSHPSAIGTFLITDRLDPIPPAPRPSNVVVVDVSDAEKPIPTPQS
jgi:hypothetical protein